MRTFFRYLRSGLILTVMMMVICGLAYPAAMTGMGHVFFPNQAKGSMITAEGEKTEDPEKAAGSALIGQDFSGEEEYFQGRVSSVNYNTYTKEQLENGEYTGVASGSFNYAPSNEELEKRVKADVELLMEKNTQAEKGKIPADLLTASGSGLDPDITPEAAQLQIPTVSKASGLSEEELREIVENSTSGKVLGIFGHERVNVLKCNLQIAEKIKDM